ncbi:MAG: hypothetical protein WCO45_10465 [Pseudanabaena sp. ELA607]
MKKKFTLFWVVAMALVAFGLAVFLGGNPSDAVGSKYKALISSGTIDAVVEPRELGLDYSRDLLAQSLTTDGDSNNLLDLLKEAEQKLAAMPEDMPLGIPLGSNSPIRIGQYPNDGGRAESSRYGKSFIAVGIVDNNGNPYNITTTNCVTMIRAVPQNGGYLPDPNEDTVSNSIPPFLLSEAQAPILLANASDSFKMAKRVPVINLIVRRTHNDTTKNYLVRNINVNAFDRDVVNAVLTNTLVLNQGINP